MPPKKPIEYSITFQKLKSSPVALPTTCRKLPNANPKPAPRADQTAGMRRDGELAAGGIPLPRRLELQSAKGLAVVGGDGRPVPAQIRGATLQVEGGWTAQ
mgnify:CR=1 FL=1